MEEPPFFFPSEEQVKDNFLTLEAKFKTEFKPLFIDELRELMPEWKRLEAVKECHVEIHTYLVLYLTWIDKRLP